MQERCLLPAKMTLAQHLKQYFRKKSKINIHQPWLHLMPNSSTSRSKMNRSYRDRHFLIELLNITQRENFSVTENRCRHIHTPQKKTKSNKTEQKLRLPSTATMNTQYKKIHNPCVQSSEAEKSLNKYFYI